VGKILEGLYNSEPMKPIQGSPFSVEVVLFENKLLKFLFITWESLLQII
jgi:hypothetical protein